MKRFHCGCSSRNTLFFESTRCIACERPTGYCPDRAALLAFEADAKIPVGNQSWQALSEGRPRYRRCANYRDYAICNWMIPEHDPNDLCVACRLNNVIPDLGQTANLRYWGRLEAAKRHALYTVLALHLPFDGLRFRFMADNEGESTPQPVVTGHRDGEITINLSEADTLARTQARLQLGERYRTLLGHFRHELGHYFWRQLIAPVPEHLQAFRELFGDERADYQQQQRLHYQHGPAGDWALRHVSPYASMHPWEDWAETWAHYMHMRDTLETAADFRLHLQVDPAANNTRAIPADGSSEDWISLAIAINALNRSMGLEDAYPFVLNDVIRTKLDWISRLVAVSAY